MLALEYGPREHPRCARGAHFWPPDSGRFARRCHGPQVRPGPRPAPRWPERPLVDASHHQDQEIGASAGTRILRRTPSILTVM